MKNSLEDTINEGKTSYSPPGNNARMEEVFMQFQDSALKALDEIKSADSEIDSIKKMFSDLRSYFPNNVFLFIDDKELTLEKMPIGNFYDLMKHLERRLFGTKNENKNKK